MAVSAHLPISSWKSHYCPGRAKLSPNQASLTRLIAVSCEIRAVPRYCCLDFDSFDNAEYKSAGMSFSPGRYMFLTDRSLNCRTLSGLSQGNIAVLVNRCSP